MKANLNLLAPLFPPLLRARLAGRDNLQKIFANAIWLLADRVFRLGAGILVTAWIARYLGTSGYGLLNYAYAFVALFGALATLGLDNIVVRDIVQNPACRDETLGTVFVLKLVGGLAALLGASAVIYALHPGGGDANSQTRLLVSLAAAGTIFQAFDTIDFYFQSQVQSRYTVYARNVGFALATALRIALIGLHAPLIAFGAAGVLEVGAGAVGLAVLYRRRGLSLRGWRFRGTRARALLGQSWPLILSSAAILIYMKIDQVMLKEMAGNGAAGIYSAATRFSEVWYFIPLSIVSSVSPTLMTLRQTSPSAYRQRLQILFETMTLLTYAIAIPMTFLSRPLVVAVFGPGFAAAGPVLAVHIWSALFVFLGLAQSPWSLAEGLLKLSFLRTLIGAVANVALNLYLIPRWGAMGASVATVIAYGLSAFAANALHPRTRPIFVMQLRAIFLGHVVSRLTGRRSA